MTEELNVIDPVIETKQERAKRKKAEYRRMYYQKNKDKMIQSAVQSYKKRLEADPEKVRKQMREWNHKKYHENKAYSDYKKAYDKKVHEQNKLNKQFYLEMEVNPQN